MNAKETASTLASTQAASACLEDSGDSTFMSVVNSFNGLPRIPPAALISSIASVVPLRKSWWSATPAAAVWQ